MMVENFFAKMVNIVCSKSSSLKVLFTLVFLCSFEFIIRCKQGKFRLKKNKPKENKDSDQSKASSDKISQLDSSQTKLVNQEQEEELPDLKDPEVQKATSLIQVSFKLWTNTSFAIKNISVD